MGRRQSRFAAICTLSLVTALLLGLGGSVLADPGKNENGKGRKHSNESNGRKNGHENGHPKDAADRGPGNADSDGGNGKNDKGSGGSSSGSSKASSGSGDGDSGSRRQSSSTSGRSDQQGNIPCSSLDSNFAELKLQNPSSGTYSDGTLTITLDRTGEGTFTWSSNIDVDAVIAKGGSNSNIYHYPGTSDGFSGSATTPTNPSNNQPYGLSHVSFCYDTSTSTPTTPSTPVTPVTTPPTTPAPTTPGITPGETPGANPGEDLVDADGDGIDDDIDDEVLNELIDSDGDGVPDTDEVGNESAERPQTGAEGELPFTGASVLAIAVFGFLIAGSGLLVVRRTRD